MLLDLDVVIEPDPAFLPFGVDVGLGRQRLERGALQLLEQRATAGAEMPRHAIVESASTSSRMAAFNSASEKNCRLRSLAMIKRVAT